MVAQTNWK